MELPSEHSALALNCARIPDNSECTPSRIVDSADNVLEVAKINSFKKSNTYLNRANKHAGYLPAVRAAYPGTPQLIRVSRCRRPWSTGTIDSWANRQSIASGSRRNVSRKSLR